MNNPMNITARRCANCANFNPVPSGLDPSCWVEVLIPSGASQREPGPKDCCELHSTEQEAAQAIVAAYPLDPELREIVKRQLAGENELKRIQNQAASQVQTKQVLDQMRKGAQPAARGGRCPPSD